MDSKEELVQGIQHALGPADKPATPHVGEANKLYDIVDKAVREGKPYLYNYFITRENHLPLIDTARGMAMSGWADVAHALLYLRYDQILKQEQLEQRRLHKGGALCDLAILQRLIGSSSGVRYYASLGMIGDVLFEPQEPTMRAGALAFQLLLQFEPRTEVEAWRDALRSQFNARKDAGKPMFAESGLAARWFPKRRKQHILKLRKIPKRGRTDFANLLLESVTGTKRMASDESVAEGSESDRRGALFEALVGLLLAATPGFQVRYAFTEADEQVDLLVQYRREATGLLKLPDGYGLVECRARLDRVRSPELRDFGAKCFMHGVQFGILAARSGITGKDDYQAAQLTRRKFFHQGLLLLVMSQGELKEARARREGLANHLRSDYERVAFGEPSNG